MNKTPDRAVPPPQPWGQERQGPSAAPNNEVDDGPPPGPEQPDASVPSVGAQTPVSALTDPAAPLVPGPVGTPTGGAGIDPSTSGVDPRESAGGDEGQTTAAPPKGQRYQGSQTPLPRVFAVANQKGGVGKTTTTVNMAACLAELGYRVLVVDLDPQANATTGLGVDPRNIEHSMYDVLLREVPLQSCAIPSPIDGLLVAPSSLDLAGAEIELVPSFNRERKLQNALEPMLAEVDYVLLDCPPSLGLLTVNALTAATEVMVPIQCEYYALEGLGQLLRNVDLVQRNLNPSLDVSTIILVMYDARTKLAAQVVDEVRAHFGERVCRQVIPRSVRLSEAPSYGLPIIHFDDRSRGAVAYRELAREVSGGASQRTR